MDHVSAWKALQLDNEVWSPSEADSFKINFDTAIKDNFLAQAAVFRDSNGKIIKAILQISPLYDPSFGEALAALLAAFLGISLKIKKFSFEGDSLLVI